MVILPMSISSINALTLTLLRSAISINKVPPPTADVGDVITCPTSANLLITVPAIGDLTLVSSRAIRAFSKNTSARTSCARAEENAS